MQLPFVSRRKYEALAKSSQELATSYREFRAIYEKFCSELGYDPRTGDPVVIGTDLSSGPDSHVEVVIKDGKIININDWRNRK